MGSNPYESPRATPSGVKPEVATHGRAIMVALAQQVFVLILGALTLDGGRLLRAICVGLIVSWLASLAVLLWHRQCPTRLSRQHRFSNRLGVWLFYYGGVASTHESALVRSSLGCDIMSA
jgi:hypothetical protein